MNGVAEILEDELLEAIEKRDRKAVKHFVKIIVENFEERKEAERRQSEIMLKLNAIEITIKEGFASMNKRFEDMQKYMDKRFEDMNIRFKESREDTNKRFEDMQKYMDKRFENMQKYMDKRFEDMNRRFEDMNKRFEDMNKRFEDMNKRFTTIVIFISIGFTVLALLITLFKFIM